MIIEKIQRQSRINVNEVIERLKKELNVNDAGKEQLNFALYDTLQLILNTTNRNYLIEDMYSIWINLIKDYWYLNGYDKKYNSSNSTSTEAQINDETVKIKSIKRGDTETTFRESNNETNINGITYKTGTINYNEEVLINRYKTQLYKFRKLGRRNRW